MLKNKTSGKKIANRTIIYRSVWLKAKGLMFSRKIDESCLIFEFGEEKIVPLHMMFVFFPIDVIYLDSSKKVVEIKKNFRPFTAYTPKREAMYVIELAAGKAEDVNLEDIIDW